MTGTGEVVNAECSVIGQRRRENQSELLRNGQATFIQFQSDINGRKFILTMI